MRSTTSPPRRRGGRCPLRFWRGSGGENILAVPSLECMRQHALEPLGDKSRDADLIVVGVGGVVEKNPAGPQYPRHLEELPLRVIEVLDDHIRRDEVKALGLEWQGADVASTRTGNGGVAAHRLQVVIQTHDHAGPGYQVPLPD